MIKSKTRWILADADPTLIESLQSELHLDPLLAKLLVVRGISNVAEAQQFLNASLDDMHDPFLLPDMEKSVERIRKAVSSGERIWIYGDYDCDGVTSTALLFDCLKDFTGKLDFYIPNRFTEGYGLNKGAIEKAKQNDVSLIITVDTGISAVDQVAFANELGIDVIITDHHEPPDLLPPAYAIINPKLPTSQYPFELLAGVGVALKVSEALRGGRKSYWLEWAAMGTIADLVPLKGENRILAKVGLEKINESPTVGVRALLEASGLQGKTITAGHIGFSAAPRINASGRLESASAAVDLLLCNEDGQAAMIANHLSSCNEERQQLVLDMIDEAIRQVEQDQEGNRHCIVVGHPGWNAGVIGIVASKLVEKYYRPTIVCSFDETSGLAKGSARSISGFHLYDSLKECTDVLEQFGGHEMAAGMSLRIDLFSVFKQKMNEIARNRLSEEDYIPKTTIDAVLPLADITLSRIASLERLAPFGMGNRAPRFMIERALLVNKRHMGRNEEHVKLTLQQEHSQMNAIAFRRKDELKYISPLSSPSVVGEIAINEWNGMAEPQMIIHDILVDSIQVHDRRNQISSAWRDVDEEQRNLLLFFTKEGKNRYQERHKAKTGSNLLRIWPEEVSEQEQREVSHTYIMEVPKSEQVLSECLHYFPSLEHVSFYWTNDFDQDKRRLSDRDAFKRLYAFLYASQGKQTRVQLEAWALNNGFSLTMIHTILSVFEELHMIEQTNEEIHLIKNPVKRELQESKTYREAQRWSQLVDEWMLMSHQRLSEHVKKWMIKAN